MCQVMLYDSKRLYIVPGHDIPVDLLLVLSTYSVSIFVKYILYQGWATGGPRAVYSPRCLLVRPAGLYYTDDFNKPYFCYISLNVNQWISKKLMHYTNLNI